MKKYFSVGEAANAAHTTSETLRCQRLVQQQDIRLGDDVDEHLHFVFHTVGVVLE